MKKKNTIDFDLRQLEIFRRVVELGSFSKAADQVFLAQASVSERIANLESSIGVKLLDRLGRQVLPTRAGELLYKHAVLLMDMKSTACLEMQNFLGIKKGAINIGGSTIPGEYILPEIIGGFHEKYPLVSVTLKVADTSEIEGLVLKGDLELGVVGSKSSHKNIIQYELWQDELVLAIPANHKWANRKTVTIEEISDQPFIIREAGSGTLEIINNYFRASGSNKAASLNVVACFGSSTAVKEGIKSGLGISILSSRALDTELKAGILKSLQLKALKMSRSFYLIRDRRRIPSPLSRAMLDFLITISKKEKR